ncbi:MAG: zinc ribbon domain-containing protein [Firmicutes bacterium]|nr:zinc ribbon domain-containing protein [Bacillota bacterium]
MNGFRQWLSRLMIGRYGNDELNRLLLIAAAVLIIIGIFVPRHWLNVVVVIILAIVYARMFSRNIPKRQEENRKYLEMKSRFTGGAARPGQGKPQRPAGTARPKKQKVEEGKRIYICPHCKGSLQVPVGAGKIRITCPHCGKTFEEIV